MLSRTTALITRPLSSHCVSLCSQVAPVVEVRSISYLAQLRRQKTGRLTPHLFSSEADGWLIGSGQLGSDHTLNSVFDNYKIDVDGLAYRNLHPRALVTLANDRTMAPTRGVSSDNYQLVFGEKGPSSDSSARVVSINDYKEIVRELKEHLSESKVMFMHDGAVGSNPKAELRLRAMTNSASSALYLNHVVPKVNIKLVEDFQHSLTLYVAPDFVPSNASSFGFAEGKGFVLVDVARGIAIVAGTNSTVAIRDALSSISSPRFLREFSAVSLHADVVTLKGQDNPILVINPDHLLLNKVLGKDFDVVGAHNTIWGEKGIYRFFDGITKQHSSSSVSSRGDHTEKLESGARYTARRHGISTGHGHPSSVVVLVSDHSKVLPPLSLIPAEHVKEYLAAGYSGISKDKQFKPLFSNTNTVDSEEATERFNALLQASKANVYVVNTAAKDKDLTDQEVSDVLRAISEGKAKPTDAKSSVFSKLAPITSILGLNINLDSATRGWDPKDHKQEAIKLEELISQKISTKPKQ